MATASVTIGQKYGLPPFSEDADFEHWLYELKLWRNVTDLSKEKQGPVLFLSLNGKVRQACASLSKKELNKEDGLDKLVKKLRELYCVSQDQAMYSAYEKFETFQRPETMTITEYINEFEHLNQKLVTYKITLPLAVLAHQLLKNANLPKDKHDLARATVAELTYDAMKTKIKAIYDYCAKSKPSSEETSDIQVEAEYTYFNRGYGAQDHGRGRGGRSREARFSSRTDNNRDQNNGQPRHNRPGPDGKPTKCLVCESIFHYAKDCPENKKPAFQEHSVQYFTKEIEQCFLKQVVSETLNCALIDTGCSATVCGKNWLQCYVDTLPENTILEEHHSGKVFRFGAGKAYPSIKQVNIPVHIGEQPGYILTDVVDCEIPLPLSKDSMKKAGSKLDFVNDVIVMSGQQIQLQHTSNGHYCIPITSKQIPIRNLSSKYNPTVPMEVFLSAENLDQRNFKEKQAIATKLHRQFGHPLDSKKLRDLCLEAGINDQELFKQSDNVTQSCDTCDRNKKARAHPVVSMPLANDFNDVLAMDLKFVTVNNRKYTILHLIDAFTRFSAASIVSSKHKEVIVATIMKQWVATIGKPKSLFSDNGGEFNNELLRDIAELLDCKVITTAAFSPRSNGIVERHNAVTESMILKIVHETKCSVENALVWAVSAKNSLHNNLGYSPNQLVFGRNPNLPSVLTAKPPALRTVTPSELIAEHLNALHTARRAFIQSESSNKLKTALQRQTRDVTTKVFNNGDHVYYKSPDHKKWRGPGVNIRT